MIGPMTLKRLMKRSAGIASSAMAHVVGGSGVTATILNYHRVADTGAPDAWVDDWNVPPAAFRRQMATIAELAEVVPLADLSERLRRPASGRPLVAITFDDGYAGLHAHVLPVLREYRLPATFFVVTDYVGRAEPMPFDRWGHAHRHHTSPLAWRPLAWQELEACVASGMVTLGSHSRRHLDGRTCSRAQIEDEIGVARRALLKRFGDLHAAAYAYPYGSTRLGHVTDVYIAAVRAAGHRLALTTDLAVVTADTDPHRLPRIEAHAWETSGTLRAKLAGVLAPYRVTDYMRRARRTA